ncbi:hypothetical protein KJ877_05200 [bacterium]|nr:hypothetical protein [bacterium]
MQKNIKRPTCLKIKSLQEETKSFIQKELTELEFKDRCDFTLEAMYYNVKACTNPMANSVGTDFDGYARITLLYKDECYYKVQQDYKGTEWQNSMKAILKHIKDDVLKAQ